MKLSYDKLTDTLYVFVGDQTDTIARDVGNGMLLKYDKKTNKTVGAIIHDFEKRFKIEQEPLEVPVPV